MIYLLLLLTTPVEEPILRYSMIPGYQEFDKIVHRLDAKRQTYVVVHADAKPEFIERLFLLASVMSPDPVASKTQTGKQIEFVGEVLKQVWGVNFLYLGSKATDSLFYRNLKTSNKEQLILFTSVSKVVKNFASIPMSQEVPWEGMVVAVVYPNQELTALGGRP